MSLSTPIVFIIFARPDLTEKVFETIAQAKPKKLFVIADAPRLHRPGEAEKCEQARAVIKKVDWDCEVFTNFSEVNIGPGRRISSGIDWVFSHVEEAIFLEDDEIPTPSFFSFCEALLEYYRHDERIMYINGDNSVNENRTQDSYYFSKYAHSWGFASWRRAWKHYDYKMKSWPEFKASGLLEQVFDDPYEQKFWTEAFDQMYADPQVIDTWDIQWMYACWSQGGLVIAPNKNLVSNHGFDREDAGHTKGSDPRARLPVTDIWEIKYPPFVVRHREADRHSFDYIFGGSAIRERDQPLLRIRRKLSSIFSGK